VAAKLWWIIQKDLASEWRARHAWPAMLVLGTLVVLLLSLQMDLLRQHKSLLAGSLLWLGIFFAGIFALDRSFAAEREAGCWDGLKLYPVSPSVVYLGKLAVNFIALCTLECVLVPLFVALADVPLLHDPGALLLVLGLGNLGLAAVGTLLSALAAGIGRSGNLTVLLALPMCLPVMLAAAESTRLLVTGEFGPGWWRWIGFLAGFAVIFATAGTVLFEFVVEE